MRLYTVDIYGRSNSKHDCIRGKYMWGDWVEAVNIAEAKEKAWQIFSHPEKFGLERLTTSHIPHEVYENRSNYCITARRCTETGAGIPE